MFSFLTVGSDDVTGLPSRPRAAEPSRDRERPQLLAAREQRRAARWMVALSAHLRLSGRPRRGVVPPGESR